MTVSALGSITQNEVEFFRNLSLLKAELDYQSRMTNAKREGRKEGLEKGLAKGLAKVRTKGRDEANIENARKMKAMGFLTEQIQAVTGLSMEIIAQL